ncbi:MAG: SDR family oxidoreductase [Verrucomicrobia bacterium]|nr:SDR family oxidoreductase [Verrucomicrobiota bacterium]
MKGLIAITGASSGIGMAAAKAFMEKGHSVLLMARREELLKSLKGDHVLCKKVDVTDLNGFKKAVHEAEAKFGPVDCLINNAGLMLLGAVQDQDPEEWKRMFDVNVLGVLNGMHIVLPGMIKRRGGTIMNISSIAGKKTFPNHAAYCGTKFAVHAITENVRQEVAPHNVRLITIAPGAVETELLSHTTSEEIKTNYEGWKKQMGKILVAEDIVRAIIYAYSQPQDVCVREVAIAYTRQEP